MPGLEIMSTYVHYGGRCGRAHVSRLSRPFGSYAEILWTPVSLMRLRISVATAALSMLFWYASIPDTNDGSPSSALCKNYQQLLLSSPPQTQKPTCPYAYFIDSTSRCVVNPVASPLKSALNPLNIFNVLPTTVPPEGAEQPVNLNPL